jgi:hypothetical protein
VTSKRELIILLMAALSACTSVGSNPATSTQAPGQIEFTISIGEDAQGGFTIALGVLNHSSLTLPADRYQDSWTLTTSDGEPRASGEGLLPKVEPTGGEPQNIILWEGPLEPGNYVLQWGVSELGSSAAHFEIITSGNRPQLGTFSLD